MTRLRWQIWLALLLVVLSISLYILHYGIFEDPHHIFIYMLGDLAFLPIEVLLVTLIIHSLLSQREKRIMLEKLNMVIETFFTEVGTDLMRLFIKYDDRVDDLRKQMSVNSEWTSRDFETAKTFVINHRSEISFKPIELEELRDLLVNKRTFLLRLLENPNLLEHENFTGILRAISHLTEELLHREDLIKVRDKDYEHLCGDISRAYDILIAQWLDYMSYLKNNYPYLFSLATRINPFKPDAHAEIM